MKNILPVFMIVLACCSSKESKDATNFLLEPDAFQGKIQSGATLIDVRSVEEYASGHISGSLNMDVNNPGFKDNVAVLDPKKEYALYCASGVRSGKAAEMLRQAGFTSVFTLTGGIKSWKEKGLPLE
ncbi:MAG TPA: rhodanese-like domain-containing protein [Cyclobacteriaceae bacterium]|nr:rhodanese-like domain-containing protein [Cyclobacteriaceae bacterium]